MNIDEYCHRNHLYNIDRKNYTFWVFIDKHLAAITGIPVGTRYYFSARGIRVHSWVEFIQRNAGREICPSDSSKQTDRSRVEAEGP